MFKDRAANSNHTHLWLSALAIAAMAALAFGAAVQPRGALFFWPGVIVVTALLLYQIIWLPTGPVWRVITLAQVLLWVLVQRLIVMPPGVLARVADVYQEYAVTIKIGDEGWRPILRGSAPTDTFPSTDFPSLHLFGSIASRVTSMDLDFVVTWVPFFWTLPAILLVYVLARKISSSDRAAILTALLFGSLANFVDFHGQYVKEAIAFSAFVGVIYAYFMRLETGDVRFVILAVVFTFAVVASHHFTSLILIVFLLLSAPVFGLRWSAFRSLSLRWRAIGLARIPSLESSSALVTSFALLVTMLAVGYWASLQFSPIGYIGTEFSSLEVSREAVANLEDLAVPPETAAEGSASSSRLRMLTLGDTILGFFVGLLTLWAVWRAIRDGHGRLRWVIAFAVMGALFGVLTLLFTQFLPSTGPGTVWGGRFVLFGYFALIVAVTYLVRDAGQGFLTRGAITALAATFVVWNLVHMPPSYYQATDSPEVIDGGRFYLLAPEERSLEFLRGTGTVLVGINPTAPKSIWSVEGQSGLTPVKGPLQDIAQLAVVDYLVVSDRDDPPLDEPTWDAVKNSARLAKVYQNSRTEIYTVIEANTEPTQR